MVLGLLALAGSLGAQEAEDFGFGEVLPVTGMNAADIGLWGAVLLLAGSLALLLGRRVTSARVRSENGSGAHG